MKILTAIIIGAVLLLPGCSTVSLTPQQKAAANFGVLPADYELAIQGLMRQTLKDPDSATYRFGKPQKGFSRDGWAVGGKDHYGYIVPAAINAKNSYGGYAGESAYYFLFSEGMIMDITFMFTQGRANYVELAPGEVIPVAASTSPPQSDATPVEQAKSWPKAAKDAATKRCEKQFESFQLQAVCLSNEKEGYEKLKGKFGMPEALSLKAKERCAKSFEMFQLQAVCMSNEYDGYKKMHE